jgi:hypothetical protein
MKILIVGMVDSVHLYRWTKQFENTNLEITIFPSRKFRKVDLGLLELRRNKNIRIILKSEILAQSLNGYFDFFFYSVLGRYFDYFSRASKLKRIIEAGNFNHVHLVEMQHAGYLYLDANLNNAFKHKLTVTNWGSDIFFFQNEKSHKSKIMELLRIADQYSAECDRDYVLAKNLGFNGVNLPIIPNAGGFSPEVISSQTLPIAQKKKIYIKGYGGSFGLGAVAIEVGIKLLNEFSWIELIIVSVSPELEKIAKELTINYPNRVKYWSIKSKLKHEEVLHLLGESIIYIGASKSDGISTTFLESLVAGAYPIQTETSCANEWTKKGFRASIVSPNFESIYNAAKHALINLGETEKLIMTNKSLSEIHLSSTSISQIALRFYD